MKQGFAAKSRAFFQSEHLLQNLTCVHTACSSMLSHVLSYVEVQRTTQPEIAHSVVRTRGVFRVYFHQSLLRTTKKVEKVSNLDVLKNRSTW